MFRDARQWTQEQLAVVAGLNVRTVQRVEQGWPAPSISWTSTRLTSHSRFRRKTNSRQRRNSSTRSTSPSRRFG
ncbi:helix-turn-helix domain-containing protein [Cupriavidus sp. RAF12]|uniref:helix-turn-helix domain-containing protein n=1 Tax=Cupriavidus sp. RAF12 TaxID=3233050 RepID=UPI003F931FE6